MKQKLIKLSDTHYIVVDNFEKPVINDFIITHSGKQPIHSQYCKCFKKI